MARANLKSTTFKVDPGDWADLTAYCNKHLQIKERVLRNEILKMHEENAEVPDTSHYASSTQLVRFSRDEYNCLIALRKANNVRNADVLRHAVYRLIHR
jgi:hypothetical protein